MKKRLIVILATLMCISLCACGGSESTSGNNKENSSTQNQTTEKDTITSEETPENDSTIGAEDLVKYYDVNEYKGTPRFVDEGVKILKVDYDNNTMKYRDCETEETYEADFIEGVYDLLFCDCIKVDNDTPDDTSDDVIVYIFSGSVDYTE